MDGQDKISVVDEVGQCIQQDKVRQQTPYFRPSQLGGCKREGFYFFLKYPQAPSQFDTRMQLILDNGTGAHEVVTKWLGQSTRYYVALEVHVHIPTLEIFGHADVVLVDRQSGVQTLVEIKSINARGFAALTRPKPEHAWQANLYAGLLGIARYVVLYWNKDTQHLREYVCPFDPALYDEALQWCNQVKMFVRTRALPPYHSETCNESFCHYVKRCRAHRPASQTALTA